MITEDVFTRYLKDQDNEIRAEIERCIGKGAYIYAMRNPETELIKIGYTTNIRYRLWDLQCRYSTKLEVIAIFPGSRKLERLLHKKFHYYRQTRQRNHLMDGPREWFQPTDNLLALLKSLSGYQIIV